MSHFWVQEIMIFKNIFFITLTNSWCAVSLLQNTIRKSWVLCLKQQIRGGDYNFYIVLHCYIFRVAHLQLALEPQIWPNRTGHIKPVNLTLGRHSYTSACCSPYKSLHISHTWWPATDIRVLLRQKDWYLSALISVSVDRCWAWRMAPPLGTDRKQRVPKGRDPVSTRAPWRIKTNRYVF